MLTKNAEKELRQKLIEAGYICFHHVLILGNTPAPERTDKPIVIMRDMATYHVTAVSAWTELWFWRKPGYQFLAVLYRSGVNRAVADVSPISRHWRIELFGNEVWPTFVTQHALPDEERPSFYNLSWMLRPPRDIPVPDGWTAFGGNSSPEYWCRSLESHNTQKELLFDAKYIFDTFSGHTPGKFEDIMLVGLDNSYVWPGVDSEFWPKFPWREFHNEVAKTHHLRFLRKNPRVG